jgi:hypothetical protein
VLGLICGLSFFVSVRVSSWFRTFKVDDRRAFLNADLADLADLGGFFSGAFMCVVRGYPFAIQRRADFRESLTTKQRSPPSFLVAVRVFRVFRGSDLEE